METKKTTTKNVEILRSALAAATRELGDAAHATTRDEALRLRIAAPGVADHLAFEPSFAECLEVRVRVEKCFALSVDGAVRILPNGDVMSKITWSSHDGDLTDAVAKLSLYTETAQRIARAEMILKNGARRLDSKAARDEAFDALRAEFRDVREQIRAVYAVEVSK